MILRGINEKKTILQLNEEQFREAGNHGDKLISILRHHQDGVKGNILTLRTDRKYLNDDPVVQAFNSYLGRLRLDNIIAIQVILEE